MSFIDAHELADARADLELTMTDPATVLRPTATDNGGGRQALSFLPVPCRWPYARIWNKQSPKDMAEALVGGTGAGQVKSLTLWYVLTAWDADIRPADRISVASLTLEVAGRDGGRTDGFGQTVICREIK